MSTPDAIRRLLEGEIDPIEIEGDANLYSMAERIYGSEVLEEMGVSPPQVDDSGNPDGLGMIPNDITLGDLIHPTRIEHFISTNIPVSRENH